MAAWGAPTRAPAAAQALGAPKGGGWKGPKQLGRPPAHPAIKPQAQNNQPKHNANPHHGVPGQGQHAHAGPPPHPAGGGEALPLVDLSGPQLAHRATKMAQAQGAAETAPLQNQAKEIGATEAAVQARYKALGEQQTQSLAGISQQAEASAKTAQNTAADNALKAGQSIETTGQAQQGLAGGYISPEVKAELQAQGQKAAGTGAAGVSLAQQSGQNEQNFMSNLRASAAARVAQGGGEIANTYGKQLRENSNKQGEVAGKVAALGPKIRSELESSQFNQQAVKGKLGSENIKLGIDKEKVGIDAQNARTKAVDAFNKAQGAKEGHNLTRAKLGLENGKFSFEKWAKESDLKIKGLSAKDKAIYDQAQVRIKEAQTTGKAPSPAEGRKYMSALSSGLTKAKAVLGTHNQGRGNAASQTQAREELTKAGATTDQINAIMNLAVYGRLSKADQAAAISYGLTPNLRQEWFREAPRKKGH